MTRFAKMHPFLCLGVVSLLLLYAPTAFGFQYDEGGFKGLLVLLGYVLGSIFRWMYLMLFTFSSGRGITAIRLLSIIFGLGVYASFDQGLTIIRNKKRNPTPRQPGLA